MVVQARCTLIVQADWGCGLVALQLRQCYFLAWNRQMLLSISTEKAKLVYGSWT